MRHSRWGPQFLGERGILSLRDFGYSPSLDGILMHLNLIEDNTAQPMTTIIDGPSGSGKTTLAALIADAWPRRGRPQVVHMDEVYPGWNGLQSGSDLMGRILHDRAQGKPAHFQRYDWALGKHTTWHAIDPELPLLVEGCGAMGIHARSAAHARIWLDGDEELRKRRALGRGEEDFAAHWDEWSAQFTEFVELATPQQFATLSVSVSE